MRKFVVLLAILIPIAFFTTNCSDNYDDDYAKQLEEYQKQVNEQYGKDTLVIQQYLADHQLTALKHESGIYYIINAPGNEYHPTHNSYITVKYKGYLTDGTVFDQTGEEEAFSASLNTLIGGWRLGVPLIGIGGKITLFLPSYYGYGSMGYVSIPANSVVIYEIELVKFT
jgi:FKBP-type peptidyl-prolyl cis-trans isomerase FkpA